MVTRPSFGLDVSILHPEGRTETFLVDDETVKVGSGAHCDIRLPSHEAATHEVSFTVVGDVVHAKARASDPLPTLDGAPFVQTPVLPDSLVAIGAVCLRVRRVSLGAERSGRVVSRKRPVSLGYLLLAVFALPLFGFVLFWEPATEARPLPPKTVPELFADAPGECPYREPDQARARAVEHRAVAEAKRERRPFDVQDGVLAVPLFRSAALCFEVAGDAPLASAMRDAYERLRDDVSADFRVHRVRLEHALSVDDWRSAEREVHVLRAFTFGMSGDYASWLSNLERHLSMRQTERART